MTRAGYVMTSLVGLIFVLLLSSNTCAATDGFYQLSRAETGSWEGAAGNLTAVPTADYDYAYGDEATVDYALPWPLTFYGQSYSRITADTNGNIWLTATSPANSFDLAAADHGPVIAVWNNDLSTNFSGGVFIRHKINPERVVIQWQTETYTEEGYSFPNDFEAVIFPDGAIRFDYKSFTTQAGTDFGSGISAGNGTAALNLTTKYGNVSTQAGSSFLFTQNRSVLLTASLAGAGSGSVISDPVGISCGALCEGYIPSGTPITLTALPVMGSYLAAWSGCDSVSGNRCILTPDTSRTVSADFVTFNVTTMSPPAAGAVGSAYSVTFLPSGGVQPLTWSINSGTLPPGVTLSPSLGVINGTPTTKGRYAFTLQATDVLGAQTVPTSVEISVTAAPPTSAILTPKNGATVIGPLVTVSGTAVDTGGAGLQSVEISADNGVSWHAAVGTSSWSYLWSALSAGECTLRSRATDLTGTVESLGTALTVTVDLPPTLILSTLSDGAATSSAVLNVAGFVTDATGISSLTINGANVPVNSDGSFTYPLLLPTGSSTITTIAIDTANNQTVERRTVTCDPLLPGLNVTAPSDNSCSNKNFITVIGNISDPNAMVAISVNGGDSQPAATIDRAFALTVNLTPGLNTLEITVSDLQGKKNSLKRTIVANGQNPTIMLSPVQDYMTSNPVQSIGGTIGDAITPVTVALSDGVSAYTPAVTNGTFSQGVTLTDKKSYPFEISVTESNASKTIVRRNILFVPPVRSNVALATNGGIATGSSTYNVSSYPVAAMNNGDRKGIKWGAGGGWNDATNNLYPDWAQITFNGKKSINEIDLFTLQDLYTTPLEPTATHNFTKYGVTAFDVQYWNGAGWATVPGGGITGNNLVWRKITFPAVITDRIRVLISASLGGYSRIVEIEAYGSDAANDLQPPTISSINPTGIILGVATSVTITGTNLTGAVVTCGNGTVGSQSTTTDTLIVVPITGSATGIGTVTVTTAGGSASGSLTVAKAIPVISWQTPAPVPQGTFLTTSQLNATASVAGLFVYTPAAGTPMNSVGVQTLNVVFTPSDTVNFTTATASVKLTVTTIIIRTNVALAGNGGIASASSIYNVSSYPIAAMNNGDRKGIKWGEGGGWNDATNNLYPDWAQITFNGQKSINEIDVFTLQDLYTTPLEPTATQNFTKYGVTAFDVQYWNGAGWATVPGGGITGNNLVWRKITFPSVITDRIRVLISASRGGYSRIVEIEAY